MALSGGPQLDSKGRADAFGLEAVLDYCETINLGRHSLERTDSNKSLYMKAITKLEKIQEVFDDNMYESFVLDSIRSEKETYENLMDKAMLVGVPDSNIPPAPSTVKHTSRPAIDSVLSTVIPEGAELAFDISTIPAPPPIPPKSPDIRVERPKSSKSSKGFSLGRGSSVSFTTSAKGLKGITALVPPPDAASQSRDVSPNASVSSLFSARSQASSRVSKSSILRPSFMQFFRKESRRTSSKSQPVNTTNIDTTMSTAQDQPSATNGHLSTPSMRTSPTSLRSSFSYGNDLDSLSPTERQRLDQSMASDGFKRLHKKAHGEASRFMEFESYQRVALPLIFGRNRIYLSERREQEIQKLEAAHESAREALEDRQYNFQIAEDERREKERTESETANATALKHVTARISTLGAEATDEHKKRLSEETTAMARLEARHSRQKELLKRKHAVNLHNLEHNQKKEMLEKCKAWDDDFEQTTQEKRQELDNNFARLDDAIKNRKTRLTAKWYLELQIFKEEDADLKSWWEGPLPMRLLGLPQEFNP